MNDAEIRRFLEEPNLAKLATINRDGTPQVTPIWYLFDGQHIVIITGPRSLKVRNIQRDPRVSVCIDRPTPPYAGVIVRGVATLQEVAYQDLALPMAVRYMGQEEGRRLGEGYATADLMTIRLPLENMYSWDFAKRA